MYAQLGDIRFSERFGFSAFARTRETIYAEIPMVNGKPRIQRTGEKLEELNIGILLHADFCVPERELVKFNDYRVQSRVLPLVLGNGRVVGDYLVVSTNEVTRKTTKDGTLIMVELEISLKEFPQPDRKAVIALQAQRDAFAVDIEKVVPQRVAPSIPTTTLEALKAENAISLKANEIDKDVDTARRKPLQRPELFNKISEAVQKVSEATLEMEGKVREIQEEVDEVGQILRDINDTARFVSDVGTAVSSGDIDQVVASNATFQSAAQSLRATSSELVVVSATREF